MGDGPRRTLVGVHGVSVAPQRGLGPEPWCPAGLRWLLRAGWNSAAAALRLRQPAAAAAALAVVGCSCTGCRRGFGAESCCGAGCGCWEGSVSWCPWVVGGAGAALLEGSGAAATSSLSGRPSFTEALAAPGYIVGPDCDGTGHGGNSCGPMGNKALPSS